jgi:GT2 family glycosyltransferase
VLLLNWNGRQDTIECLESLRRSACANVQVVVLDNGSSDGSLAHFAAWALNEAAMRVVSYSRQEAEAGGDCALEQEAFGGVPLAQRLILVDNGENLGFAGGNNVGIRLALARGSRYVMLLNNDTVVDASALAHLVALLESEKTLVGATAQIRYYDEDIVWNCGGDLTWYGARRYHLHGAAGATVPLQGWRPVSFVTGCAALFRTALFAQQGLLSEQFFFGEEDFELAQRLKRARLPLACCYGALVRHKVSRSVNQAAQASQSAQINKIRLHYLNRLIDMRSYFSPCTWWAWRSVYMVYIFVLLSGRLHVPWDRTLHLLRTLWVESAQLPGVSRTVFERVLRGEPAAPTGTRP